MARRPPFSARPPSLRRKKPLMLPQPESSSRSCRRGNYQPGRGRGLAGGFTSSLGDLGSAETPRQRQPPPSQGSWGPTFPAAFAAPAHDPLGTVVSFQSRLRHGGSTSPPSWKVEARRGGAAGPDPVGVGRIPSRPVAPGWDRGPGQRALSRSCCSSAP